MTRQIAIKHSSASMSAIKLLTGLRPGVGYEGNRRGKTSLDMSVYSSAQGIPAALVEERDACGVGFIARLNNQPSHDIVKQALAALTCMEHRGASSADNISGDGAGQFFYLFLFSF